MDKNKIKKATPAPEDWKVWKDLLVKLQQNSPEYIDTGAKQIITLITLVITVYGVIGIEQMSKLDILTQYLIKGALIFWLISAFLALLVLIPAKYELVDNSTDAIKQLLKDITSYKRNRLIWSLALFGIGVALFGIGIILT